VPYLSASEVMIHEEALYHVYIPLPLSVSCFQLILTQVLPNFLLTCMNVLSTTELSDVIVVLLNSQPQHPPPDLDVAWLRCIKQLAKSACFSAPGNL